LRSDLVGIEGLLSCPHESVEVLVDSVNEPVRRRPALEPVPVDYGVDQRKRPEGQTLEGWARGLE